MISSRDAERLQRATAYDSGNDKIGSVIHVYLDDETGEPTWAAVHTGLFGTRSSFVPLEGASLEGDDLRVAYPKDQIKDAPNIDVDQHLSDEEADTLYSYYDMSHSGDGQVRETPVTGVRETPVAGTQDRRQDTGDAGMVLHEEQVRTGTETRETGRARLRKYVETENQTVDVPVSKEKLVVEREPVSGERSSGPITDTDETEEITLREERPVVDKETVAVEKVNVGKETVTDTERVSTDVRREKADVDLDGDVSRDPDSRI